LKIKKERKRNKNDSAEKRKELRNYRRWRIRKWEIIWSKRRK